MTEAQKERTLVERAIATAAQFPMTDLRAITEQCCAEINSLRQQVETLTKERNRWHKAAMDAGVIVCANGRLMFATKDRAEAAKRRLAEVRAEEREACAKIAKHWNVYSEEEQTVAKGIASAIRNQGVSNG